MMREENTEVVYAALMHVREHFPNVCRVTYDYEGNWTYETEEGEAPEFDSRINVSLLEEARAKALWNHIYHLEEEN